MPRSPNLDRALHYATGLYSKVTEPYPLDYAKTCSKVSSAVGAHTAGIRYICGQVLVHANTLLHTKILCLHAQVCLREQCQHVHILQPQLRQHCLEMWSIMQMSALYAFFNLLSTLCGLFQPWRAWYLIFTCKHPDSWGWMFLTPSLNVINVPHTTALGPF